MKIEELSLSAIKPYERNPRKNDSAVNGVAESIKQFGFKQPIVIDKNNVIVAGHTRYKAAKQLGLNSVPCVRADDLTTEQVKAYRILDNKLNELATWDLSSLDSELSEFNFDFGSFDIQFPDFDFATENSRDSSSIQGFTPATNVGNVEQQSLSGVEVYSGTPNNQSLQNEDASCLPEELQGIDLAPNPIQKIEGTNKTLLDRVIIVFPAEKKQVIADLLGLEKIDKVVYSYEEINCGD